MHGCRRGRIDTLTMGNSAKNRLRPQRKFAQGAYVPPQSTPPSAALTPGAAHASHKAGTTPGPVTKNGCTARDLLSRMSLGKAHHHTEKVPMVLLENYCDTRESQKGKYKDKRHHNRKILRKLPINVSETRRASVSDSGEDTPLSCLQSPQETLPKQANNGSATPTAKSPTTSKERPITTVAPLHSTSQNATSNRLTSRGARQTKTCPSSGLGTVAVRVERHDLTQVIPSKSSSNEGFPSQKRPKHDVSNAASSLKRTKHFATADRSSHSRSNSRPAPDGQPNKADGRNNRFRLVKTKKPNFCAQTFSDASSVSTKYKDSRDPDYVASASSKKCYSFKKKELTKERRRNDKIQSTSIMIPRNNTRTTGKNRKDKAKIIAKLTTQSPVLVTKHDDFSESESSPRHNTLNWVNTHYQETPCIASTSRTTSPIPGPSSAADPPPNVVNPTEVVGAPKVVSLTDVVSTTVVVSPMEVPLPQTPHFKVPHLPVRFSKRVKSTCPVRSILDLHELLNAKESCYVCRRCICIQKYNEVLQKLPQQLVKPGTFVHQKNELLKSMRRGRELVSNVITARGFPFWLCNFDMHFHKDMFHNEQLLGTLKATLELDPNDPHDLLVEKVIKRIGYLDRCLEEDKLELGEANNGDEYCPQKRTSLPQPEQTPPTLTGKTLLKGPIRPTRRRSEIDVTMPPTDAILTDPRQPVVLLTMLNKVEGLDDKNRATEASTAIIGKKAGAKKLCMPTVQEMPPAENSFQVEQTATRDKTKMVDPPPTKEFEMLSSACNWADFRQGQEQRAEQENRDDCDTPMVIQTPYGVPKEYRPTVEEFQDPITYIKTIEKEASKYGICKIIPPANFHVPCHFDDSSMFSTTNQHLGRLYYRWGPNSREMASIMTCLVRQCPRDKDKEPFTKAPLFDGVELDLVKLFGLVIKQGGVEPLISNKEKWAKIAEQMNLVSPRGKPDARKLEKLYWKHVLPYESLTPSERENAFIVAEKIWNIRVLNQIRRTSHPLLYQKRLMGEPATDEWIPAPEPGSRISELHTTCKPIYDRIEECTSKGRPMNMATFRRIAARIQGMRFPNGQKSMAETEAQYWSLLNLAHEHVCVLSAFIDTAENKLGHESDPKTPGGSHPWNLKRVGENPKNILSLLGKTLSVTVPTLCLNQLYSTSCWHMDPHRLSWLDYMHEGATKVWYAVPASDAAKLRRAVHKMTVAAVQDKGIWLASDTTMIPPGNLLAHDVPVQRIEQNPNEFIVVFPGAYACSIATGLSVSESIYFEGFEWLDHVDAIFMNMQKDCEPSMFSCVTLLMRMATSSSLHPDVTHRVYLIMTRLFNSEFDARRDAVALNCTVVSDQGERREGEAAPVSWTHQEECSHCRMPLILSKTFKYDDPRTLLCLPHGLQSLRQGMRGPELAEPPLVTLLYSSQELKDIASDLERRVMNLACPETTGNNG